MKKNISFAILSALLIAGCAGNKMLREAETHYKNDEFAVAARLYENYIQHVDSNKLAMIHLADCYRQMNRNTDAEKWYALSVPSCASTPADELHFAEVLKENGKYADARTHYQEFLSKQPGDQFAENQLASCDEVQFGKSNPFFVAEPVDFGFAGSCFGAQKFGDSLLITAEAPLSPGSVIDQRTGRGYLDLYFVSKKKPDPSYLAATDGAKETPDSYDVTPLSGDVNSSLHEGPAVIAPGGHFLYFTRSYMIAAKSGKTKAGRAKDNDNHLELCSAELINGNWTHVQSMPFNSPEFSSGHPAISADGRRIWFASDRPGGFGGTDIYFSDYENGVWNAPVNAGNSINTAGNEMFPTLRRVIPGVEELYFSSDGLPGAGGLDLFRCALDASLQPERLDAPFNSNADDFGLIFTNDGKEGYFSSNRNDPKELDKIYRFHRLDPRFFVDLTVIDKESGVTVPQAEVEVTDMHTLNSTMMKTDSTGHLVFPADSMSGYGFTLRCSSYFCGFSSVTTGGFRGKLVDTSFAVAKMEKIVINKPIRLENIYYDYNKWNIRPDAAIELDKLVKIMLDNPKIRIELSSHTDCRGSDSYNMKLSAKRAQAAVDYIISKGVSRDRIYAKGYGESVPLNKCVNGMKCSEDEYQLNRRTEFKVVQILD